MRSVSSNSAIGVMVRRSAPGKAGDLALRVVSGLVLAPLAVLLVYLGAPYLDLLVLFLGAAMAWEWVRLCGEGELDPPGYAVIAAVGTALAAGALRHYSIAGWIIAAGAMAAAVLAARSSRQGSFWYALGTLYTALPCLAVIWLRESPQQGREIVLWLLFVVWATDIGAYVAGRTIGGPKMAPRISPNKTWAGLAGGMACAGLVGAVAAWTLGGPGIALLAVVSILLAGVAQAGDLLESALKRRFGAKDSSHLIPGHGGLLDRLDGLLAASLVVWLMIWTRGASL